MPQMSTKVVKMGKDSVRLCCAVECIVDVGWTCSPVIVYSSERTTAVIGHEDSEDWPTFTVKAEFQIKFLHLSKI